MHINLFVNAYFRIQFPHVQRFAHALFLTDFFLNGNGPVFIENSYGFASQIKIEKLNKI